MIGLLLVWVTATLPAGGQEAPAPLDPINALRDDDELPPLAASDELDAVAEAYLAAMIERRCVCPVADGAEGVERLLSDVRRALGSEAALLDAGLAVGYGQSAPGALRTAGLDPAHGAAILGERLTLAGVATAAVAAEAGWLAPPPGGVGPEIDLSGYKLAVIVTAGTGP